MSTPYVQHAVTQIDQVVGDIENSALNEHNAGNIPNHWNACGAHRIAMRATFFISVRAQPVSVLQILPLDSHRLHRVESRDSRDPGTFVKLGYGRVDLKVIIILRGSSMRPVHKGTAPSSYSPATLSFNAPNAAVIAKVLTSPTPTLAEYLEVWLNAVKTKGMAHPPPNSQDIIDAGDLIEGKIETVYKLAAVPLTERLGAYCSYCETAVPGLIEVEHVAPKAEYPTFSADWDNFLIACSPCNTSKREYPTRSELRNWRGADLTTEASCYGDIRGTYLVWPDREPSSYRLFPSQMFCDPGDQGTWVPVHYLDASNLDNVITSVSLGTRTVRADLPTLGEYDVRVVVQIDPSVNSTWPKASQATRTVGLCKLNDMGKINTTYDRRVLNRTRAWFEVLKVLKSITRLQSAAAFDAAWTGLISAAESRGFFSLWVRIYIVTPIPMGRI